MKKVLLLLTITVLTGKITEAAPLIQSESISSDFGNSLNKSSATDDGREGRSSPVGSIGGYITNYQEKKRQKQQKQSYNKNPVFHQKPSYIKKAEYSPKPAKGSYYQKNQKHCFYGHIFVRC